MFVPLSPLEFRRRAVSLFPHRTCVVDGDLRLTYAQFDERVSRQAEALRRLGLRPGETVSFISANTHHLLEAYYGVLQAGGVLNPINIRLGAGEIAYILNHADTRVLCYHAELAPLIQDLLPKAPDVRAVVCIEGGPARPANHHDYEALLAAAAPSPEAAPVRDENAVCELFYTSGTTGHPKGVALTHRALYLHAMQSIATLGLHADDVFLHVVPLFHVNGWGTPQFLTAVGGTHVMLRAVRPEAMCELIERERVTRLFCAPTVINTLCHHPDLARYDLSSLRQVAMGGAPPSEALVQLAEERLGCTASNIYGLTETAPLLLVAAPRREERALAPDARRRQQSRTGWEFVGVHIRVVREDGTDVEANGREEGEIAVRSNTVMHGYFKDPEATAAVIRDGWFHTGDIATIDEARSIYVVDRKKDIIISGGENIASLEVENVLLAHAAVFECAVIGVPDDRWGEVPAAIVVRKPGASVAEDELIAHARARLAHFKCPRRVEFRDALPKSITGKILKRELREPFWAGRSRRV